jgi:hypothetical protein
MGSFDLKQGLFITQDDEDSHERYDRQDSFMQLNQFIITQLDNRSRYPCRYYDSHYAEHYDGTATEWSQQ